MSFALASKPACTTIASMVAGAWHQYVARWLERWRGARREIEGRRAVDRLNDHLLKDIGLTRWEVEGL
jgi:uncharacterized protein YjiS (DUF1127 family)